MHDLLELLSRTQIQNSLASGLILLVLGWLSKAFTPRARVFWGVSHEFHFNVPAQPNPNGGQPSLPYLVRTQTVYVSNSGRATAEEVEVYLGMKPQHFQLWPLVNYEGVTTPENFYVVKVPNLGPKEHFTMELLQVGADLPFVQRVRTKSGEAERVGLVPQRVVPGWLSASLWLLVAIGAWTTLKVILDFLRTTGSH